MCASKFSNILGVAVPVFSLRSKHSCGVGDFLSLIPFAYFCKKAGISLIQILPVNDTGLDASPYNVVSAFALHPLYLCLYGLSDTEEFENEMQNLRTNFQNCERVCYEKILNEKLRIARKVFDSQSGTILQELRLGLSDLATWILKNPWVKSYAYYKYLKMQNLQSSWKTWSRLRTPTQNDIEKAWEISNLQEDIVFFAWIQFHLHNQLLLAKAECGQHGIILKGDIPILLNEDSCDVWEHFELFRSDITAGSPPDADNPQGQNWGFPLYFWENHKESEYAWWKNRLKLAATYFDAFRIDHILGFFRIWAIAQGEKTACLGRPIPQAAIKQKDVTQAGFSLERIRWMSEPHIRTDLIMQANGGDYFNAISELQKVATRINEEELWLFRPEIKAETTLDQYQIPEEVKKVLKKIWLDRMLIAVKGKSSSEKLYSIAWNFQDTTAWASFSNEEKASFLELATRTEEKNLKLWKKQGLEILETLTTATEMKAFAEDLGAIPPVVPPVLQKLNIASLKVMRWARAWQEENQPFIPLKDYPANSVTTTSTHDTSTFKAWWENEMSFDERLAFLNTLDISDLSIAETPLDAEKAFTLLHAIRKSNSKFVIFPIQDLFMINHALLPFDERINTPGTVSENNWSYFIPVTVETLLRDEDFIKKINALNKVK